MKLQAVQCEYSETSPQDLARLLVECLEEPVTDERVRRYAHCIQICKQKEVLCNRAIQGLSDLALTDKGMRASIAIMIIGAFEKRCAEPVLIELLDRIFPGWKTGKIASVDCGEFPEVCVLTAIVHALIQIGSQQGVALARALSRSCANANVVSLMLLECMLWSRANGSVDPELEAEWRMRVDPRFVDIEKGIAEGIPVDETICKFRRILGEH